MNSWTLLMLGAVATLVSCTHTIDPTLNVEVERGKEQAAIAYADAASVKAKNQDKNGEVQAKYQDLVEAHDAWRLEVKRAIVDNVKDFKSDSQYKTAAERVDAAAKEFATAVDEARGPQIAGATVPELVIGLIEAVWSKWDKKKRESEANRISEELKMKRWEEIGKNK